MNIDDLKIGEIKQLISIFGNQVQAEKPHPMIGKYVIVRCRDAGVHAGVLESAKDRECVLNESRRLWYWKPANGAAFLSGVASEGLHENSKVGAPVRICLTEDCEIIECTEAARKSITALKSHAA